MARRVYPHAERGARRTGGPFHASSGESAGSIWIVETEDEDAAEQLVKMDPFSPTGLRKSYRILAWTRVFAYGKRLIHPE